MTSFMSRTCEIYTKVGPSLANNYLNKLEVWEDRDIVFRAAEKYKIRVNEITLFTVLLDFSVFPQSTVKVLSSARIVM